MLERRSRKMAGRGRWAYGVEDPENDVYIYPPNESIAHNPAGTPLDEQINVKIGIGGAEYVYNIETGHQLGSGSECCSAWIRKAR